MYNTIPMPQHRRSLIMAFASMLCCCIGTSGKAEEIISQLTGDRENRVDILFLGDGYQQHELGTYHEHLDGMLEYMFQQEPFVRYRNFFNVHRIEVVSNESGADAPPEGIHKDTALNSSFYFDGETDRLLFIDTLAASQILLRSIPLTDLWAPDMQFVSVNSDRYGGAGGPYAVFAGGNPEAFEIAVHEIAHAFSNLADEYVVHDSPFVGFEPAQPNVTTSANGEKWEHWIGYEQPDIGTIGVYEGGLLHATGIYRPSIDSKMRTLGKPFDAVAREAIVLDIYSYLDPIDNARPSGDVISDGSLWIDVIDPDVIDLQWYVNNTLVSDFGMSEFQLSMLTDLGLLPGDFEIRVEAADNTDWVRIRQDTLRQEVSWNVRYFPGDFNDDLTLNSEDVDRLATAAAANSNDLAFDLNQDQLVNQHDIDRWLEMNQTFYGDANLDGTVDFQDFLVLSSNFGRDGKGWSDGNFDLDNEVNFGDFLRLSGNFGSTRAMANTLAVPEPQMQLQLLFAALIAANLRRRSTLAQSRCLSMSVGK